MPAMEIAADFAMTEHTCVIAEPNGTVALFLRQTGVGRRPAHALSSEGLSV